MTTKVLRIDASARRQASVSRDLVSKIINRIEGAQVITRDVARDPIPQIDETWVNANFTPAEDRSKTQAEALSLSDRLIAEVREADVLVIGLPIYNFGVPAALKAWIDQIARAGVTFRYTEAGPQGLLEGKRAIVAVASGGTEAGSDVDFATGYVRQVLGFIGIHDVEFVTADRLSLDAEGTLKAAEAQVEALDLAA